MKIEIHNLPVIEQFVSCIKAIKMTFGLSLVESKNQMDEYRRQVLNNPDKKIPFIGKTELPIPSIREFINSTETDKNGYHLGCGLKNVRVVCKAEKNMIESKGMQMFNVPNTQEGKEFIAMAQRYLNNGQYKIKNRGRGSRKDKGNQSFIPLSDSEWIAVYIQPKESKA